MWLDVVGVFRGERADFPLFYTATERQEVEDMSSWVGYCDAISVNSRFIRGCNRRLELERSQSPVQCAEGIGKAMARAAGSKRDTAQIVAGRWEISR